MHRTEKGFSLVELAAVLVIVGLIMAGVLKGRDMLDRSKIASVIQEMEAHKSAFFKFKEKYQQLPGDMVDAYSYFDTSATNQVCGNNGVATSNVGNCNGDGDARINNGVPNGYAETLRGWQHMSLAKMIDGRYSGVGGANRYQPGENIPFSQMENGAGYELFTADTTTVYSTRAHVIRLAKPNSSTALRAPALTVDDAMVIDQKLDDGVANTGNVLAEDSLVSGLDECVDGSSQYVLDAAANEGNEQCTVTYILEALL